MGEILLLYKRRNFKMCGIYKITNNINGKIYVGKSINIDARWKQHVRDSMVRTEQWESNHRGVRTPFHCAIRKYGSDNFIVEILEECDEEQLNEKEKYWIKELNSTNKDIGYNVTFGGDGYSCGGGENAPGCKITKQESDFIKQKLKERWTAKQIQEFIPIATSTMISDINTGKTWFDENEVYPISINNGHRSWSDKEAMKIKERYANGETIIDLAKELGVQYGTISNLVKGKSYTNLPIIERKVDWEKKNPNRKFSDDQVRAFRKKVAEGCSIKSLHESCGIECTYAAFYNMIKRITYKDII